MTLSRPAPRGLSIALSLTVAAASILLARPTPLAAQAVASPQPATSAAAPLEVHWKLIELDGESIPTDGPPEQQAYIYLQSEGDKLSGSGGCNHLFGSFDLNEHSLEFHSVRSTMMVCPGTPPEREQKLVEALRLAAGFQLSGNILALRLDNRVLARFEATR